MKPLLVNTNPLPLLKTYFKLIVRSRYWTLDACDDYGQRWIVHHDDLLKAVVLLGAMLGVDWEDG